MRAALSLQLALYRRQRQQIRRAVEQGSPAFRRYEAAYRRRTRSFRRALAFDDVVRQVLTSDVVYVGDYHTLRAAQRTYGQLLDAAVQSGRRVVVALEWVERRHQAALNDYLAGRTSRTTLRAVMGQQPGRGFDLWEGFGPILERARESHLQVLAIDRRARGPHSLAVRDVFAARWVARAAAAPDRPLVLVLAGQFHVAPGHLPAEVSRLLGAETRRALVVYQNSEDVWWRLAARGRTTVDAVEIRRGELCVFNASPVVCQQSFLDYLEAEEDDAPITDRAVTDRFRELARLIARFLGVPIQTALADVEVSSSADLSFVRRLQRRGGLGRADLARLRRQVLNRESYYVPQARLAYLASSSLNHVAEEAAHFVRHCCVGHAMAAERPFEQAFYARILEEAIGFFGSTLVNPRRTASTVAQWTRTFQHGDLEQRRIAAFVLAHVATGPEAGGHLVPRGDEALFHAVSHALGYRLGAALAQAQESGALQRADIRRLFRDPFTDPRATYRTLSARFAAQATRAA